MKLTFYASADLQPFPCGAMNEQEKDALLNFFHMTRRNFMMGMELRDKLHEVQMQVVDWSTILLGLHNITFSENNKNIRMININHNA
ncbi:hypothetical protein [Paenibacillus sp.]|jgi:predicted AlkP superfamily phosphohydrolase/phosphomutase|uniref:hypothetical protein n=1 Tax=Paenibacillus sp. TaxID=58172 RepID=UPI0028186153|nr:hypothetical protein [Paenibacillus sp.]MDR0271467.1 hypothetical protein [Paenibacillus sp.]